MDRYQDFIKQNSHREIVLFELDVGPMTLNIIKHSFSTAAYHWASVFLVRINEGEPPTHDLLKEKIITLGCGIAQVLSDLVSFERTLTAT